MKLVRILFVFAAMVAVLKVSAQSLEDGVIVRGNAKVTPILVRSSDQEALSLLNAAFNAHGAYRVVGSAREADFAVQVDPFGSNRASLKITSGVPERELHNSFAQGETTRDAVLRAIDDSIRRTSGLEGFFAGKIAYVQEGHGYGEVLYRDFFFGPGKQITSDRAEVVRPRWSPDGNYIVFTSYKKTFPNIYRVDLRSNTISEIAAYKGTNTSARYSPAGDRIAMIITAPNGHSVDLYVAGSDGRSGMKRIVASDGAEATPCWSPDGNQIVFASDLGGGLLLYRTSAYGGGYSAIPTRISGYCAEPDWNPKDPDKIAFTYLAGGKYQIAVYSFSQGKSEFLTNVSGDATQAHWLPDGRHILFTWKTGRTSRIVLMDTVTKKRTTLSQSNVGNVSQASYLKR